MIFGKSTFFRNFATKKYTSFRTRIHDPRISNQIYAALTDIIHTCIIHTYIIYYIYLYTIHACTCSIYIYPIYTRCLRKNCAKLLLSELRHISINFNNFWQVDGKMAEIFCYIQIFHITSLMLSRYLVKHKSAKILQFLRKTVTNFCQNFVLFPLI